jgi:hypothetical protein
MRSLVAIAATAAAAAIGPTAPATSDPFANTPIFFADAAPADMMQAAPPFGYRFQSTTLSRVIQYHRNATAPTERKFGTCAVVGNSGTLLLQRLGAEIDAHDAVIRVNHAPVAHAAAGAKYVPHAGRRTTWRLVTSRWRDEQAKDPMQRLLVLCDRPYIYSCQNLLFGDGKQPLAHNINPLFYGAVRSYAGNSRIPLAGLVAAAVARRSCDKVDTYGLSAMQHPDQPPGGGHTDGLTGRAGGKAGGRTAGGSGRGGGGKTSGKGGIPGRVCSYYYSIACRNGIGMTDAQYHRRPGDREFHDFNTHAKTLLAWNSSGAISIRVR